MDALPNVLLPILPWCVGVPLLVLLLPSVGGPLLIRWTMKHAAEPRLIPFPLDHPSLPPEVARDFQTVTDALRPDGFEPVAGLALSNQVPRVKAIVLLLANRPARALVAGMAVFGENAAGPPRRVFSVEFVTRFRDGTAVSTSNSSEPTVFAPRPRRTTGRFPVFRDASRLYRLHQELVARAGGGQKVLRLDEEFGGDARATLAASMIEELEDQVQTGYLYLSPREKLYRPTCKGALLMTWKLLWPFKTIQRRRVARTARRLMTEFGIEPE